MKTVVQLELWLEFGVVVLGIKVANFSVGCLVIFTNASGTDIFINVLGRIPFKPHVATFGGVGIHLQHKHRILPIFQEIVQGFVRRSGGDISAIPRTLLSSRASFDTDHHIVARRVQNVFTTTETFSTAMLAVPTFAIAVAHGGVMHTIVARTFDQTLPDLTPGKPPLTLVAERPIPIPVSHIALASTTGAVQHHVGTNLTRSVQRLCTLAIVLHTKNITDNAVNVEAILFPC